jgi:hypothetical protein
VREPHLVLDHQQPHAPSLARRLAGAICSQ